MPVIDEGKPLLSLNFTLRRLYHRWLRPDPATRLRANGLVVGERFKMLEGASIDFSHCWHICIGDDVTLAPGVRILAHDASTKRPLGYARIGKVIIGDRVFIGAGSIVLPGVTIGDDVVIGAGSVVTRDVPGGSVAHGNPARVTTTFDDFLARRREEMERVPCFGDEYTLRHSVTDRMRDEMNERMKDGIGYVS